MKDEILKNLQTYLEKDKFSAPEWLKRGLNPSSDEICQLMTEGINNCCKDLIEIQKANNSPKAF